MSYHHISVAEVQPGDDIIISGGELLRVTAVEQASDAVCLHGYHFVGGEFNALPGSYTDLRKNVVLRVNSLVGRRVRFSDALKEQMGGACQKAGHHLGPFDSEEDDKACYSCSWDHVREFGGCEGVIEGFTDYNSCKPGDKAYDHSKVGPEVRVRWEPSGLRYNYALDGLVTV